MTRLPALSARKIIKALERAGFFLERQRGSHLLFVNPQTNRRTIVTQHDGKDVKRGLMKEILRQAGLTEDQFRDLL